MRCLAVAAVIALSCLPLAAHAEDAALCDALSNIMPGANSGFSGIKRQKTDKNIYAVAINLPYAHECELRYERDDKTYEYACYYRVNDGQDAKAVMANYADNIAACRPDMVRDNGDLTTFNAPQGEILLSWFDAYPNEFTIYIQKAD